MATYHTLRKEWAKAIDCCEEGLAMVSEKSNDAAFNRSMTCDRREALMHLEAGKPLEAFRCLAHAPEMYVKINMLV